VTAPILALRAAILAATQGDAALAALMGGAVRIHDEPPRAAEPVYAVFGDAAARDWSTGADRGHVHEATIVVWAREGSARSALLAAEHIAAFALPGHRLVSLRVVAMEAGRDADTRLARATLRLRAVTEVT
jgi:Protein of unknown function (DUF3168)